MNRLDSYFDRLRAATTLDHADDMAIHYCPELIDCIQQVGFLPLLDSSLLGYSAEGLLAEECRFTQFDDGSWEWPLWQWKGPVVKEGNCVYGKFFAGKAAFVSRDWWPCFCTWRRHTRPQPEEGTIADIILATLRDNGSMIARELRAVCDFTGSHMRSKFDAIVNRLQMGCYIVTEDFVYPVDKHGREYGFGWSLLTTPERLLGKEACRSSLTPQQCCQRMEQHLKAMLPRLDERQIKRILT